MSFEMVTKRRGAKGLSEGRPLVVAPVRSSPERVIVGDRVSGGIC
jgi:hypothetical protein